MQSPSWLFLLEGFARLFESRFLISVQEHDKICHALCHRRSLQSYEQRCVGLYQPTYGVYAATKAGVEALTHILAKELGGRGITVNAVAPGPTATGLFLDDKDQATIDRIAKMAPLGRLGQPEDIAAVVAFLAGPDGGWVSGQVLRANGGIV